MNIGQYIVELKVFAETAENALAEYWLYGLMIACVMIVMRIIRKWVRNTVTKVRINKIGELRDWGLPFWSMEDFNRGFEDYLTTRSERVSNAKDKIKTSK